jgi:choline-sulfatase
VNKPNILLIMADQLAPQFLPCYGHKVVKAPTLTKLADEGVVFESAYTNSPLCAPSRFVMMSGRLPSKISAWDNAVEFSSEVPTYSHYLSSKGYRTCLSGKMHFVGPDQLHGYQDRLTTDVYPSDFTWHPDWDRADERLDWYHNMEVVTKAGPCKRSMYLDYDDEAVFSAKRYLFDYARDDSDEPFFLTLSMIQPHDPYLCREDKWNSYKEEDIDLPATPLGAVKEDPHAARLRHSYGASDVELNEQQIRNARRAYYGSISDIDDKVADVLNTIEEAGLSDNTIVIFTADHGDMLGERGMWFKMSYLEHSARVPLIVHAPKHFSERRVKQSVSLVDLLPTLVEMANDGKGFDYATPLEGRSLMSHLTNGKGHDEVIGEYFGEGVASPMFMIRRGTRKFITSEGSDHLYDLANDPHERNNLANNLAFKSELEALKAEISQNYDLSLLQDRVLESQHRRAFLKGVMQQDKLAWDYAPFRDAKREYIRNNMPPYQLEKNSRFPKI